MNIVTDRVELRGGFGVPRWVLVLGFLGVLLGGGLAVEHASTWSLVTGVVLAFTGATTLARFVRRPTLDK